MQSNKSDDDKDLLLVTYKATAIGWVECIQNIAIRHVIQEESRKRFRIHSGEGSRSKDDGDELE